MTLLRIPDHPIIKLGDIIGREVLELIPAFIGLSVFMGAALAIRFVGGYFIKQFMDGVRRGLLDDEGKVMRRPNP